MKSFIFAITILCSVILCTVLVALYTNKIMCDFDDTIDREISNNPEDVLIGIEEVAKEYQNIHPFLTLFMRENDVKEIEMYIEDIRSAAKDDDKRALTEAKSRLKLHIFQLRRLSVFSRESIF